ncbi:uncharacterized protein LOC100187511 [Ciona intestinalis]
MESVLSSPVHSCSLCENRINLSSECCCKDSEEDIFEIKEDKLLRRCNLEPGDKVCAKHLEKVKSGIIFGGSGIGCCAPFHLGTPSGKRLRSVPKPWRPHFEKSEPSPRQNQRYMPTLQICDQCYNVTMDIMHSADKLEDDDVTDSDYDVIISSPQNKYMSPRKWVSSLSMQCMGGSNSGSTWSLSSTQSSRTQPTGDFLSLYAAHTENPSFPQPIPDSIRRFFRHKSKTPVNFNGFDSFSNISTDSETPRKRMLRRVSTASLNLKSPDPEEKEDEKRLCFKIKDENDVIVSSAHVSLERTPSPTNQNASSKRQAQKISPPEKEGGEILSNEMLTNGGDSVHVEAQKSMLELNLGGPAIISAQAPSGIAAPEKIDIADVKPEEIQILDDSICCVNVECDGRVKTTLEMEISDFQYFSTKIAQDGQQDEQITAQAIYMDNLAESLAGEVVSFVLNRFSPKKNKESPTGAEQQGTNVETFSGALAHNIVQFVLYKSADKKREDSCNHESAAAVQTYGDELSNAILRDVKQALRKVNSCDRCGEVLLRECANVVMYAQQAAEVITSTALKEIVSRETLKQPLEERAANASGLEAYSDTKIAAETKAYFENVPKSKENISTSWDEDKKCFRSVISVKVNGYSTDKPEELKENPGNTGDTIQRSGLQMNPKTVECYIEDLYPVTRSLSSSFLNENTEEPPLPTRQRSTSMESFFLMLCTPVASDEGLKRNTNETVEIAVSEKVLEAQNVPETTTQSIGEINSAVDSQNDNVICCDSNSTSDDDETSDVCDVESNSTNNSWEILDLDDKDISECSNQNLENSAASSEAQTGSNVMVANTEIPITPSTDTDISMSSCSESDAAESTASEKFDSNSIQCTFSEDKPHEPDNVSVISTEDVAVNKEETETVEEKLTVVHMPKEFSLSLPSQILHNEEVCDKNAVPKPEQKPDFLDRSSTLSITSFSDIDYIPLDSNQQVIHDTGSLGTTTNQLLDGHQTTANVSPDDPPDKKFDDENVKQTETVVSEQNKPDREGQNISVSPHAPLNEKFEDENVKSTEMVGSEQNQPEKEVRNISVSPHHALLNDKIGDENVKQTEAFGSEQNQPDEEEQNLSAIETPEPGEVIDSVGALSFADDSIAKVLTRRRRAAQFMRAASAAVLVRKAKSNENANKSDPEDDDVAEALCEVMDLVSPRLLRWKQNIPSDEGENTRGRGFNSILKGVVIISVLGIVFFSSWKYFEL